MAESFSTLRINPDLMLDTFIQLALIGATGDDGVSRATFEGASHAPREFTKWEDCVNGANVLLQTVLRLGNR